MTSSRAALKKPITRSGSRETAFSVENPYKPGFLDPSTPESFQMSIDSELSAISNAFYQSAEVTSNMPSDEDLEGIQEELDILAQEITRVEAESDAGIASIQEELVILGDADTLLAQQITELEASTEAGFASVSEELTVLSDADTVMAQRITDLEVETDQGFASIEEDMSVISDDIEGLEAKWSITADVNGKISGIELTNDGVYSEFIVMADRFAVTDGTENSEPPFEVVNGSTRIKSAYVNTIQSDNWDGGANGWFISNNGDANFQNVTIRGDIVATSFSGVSGYSLKTSGRGFSATGEGSYQQIASISLPSELRGLDPSVKFRISGYVSVCVSGNAYLQTVTSTSSSAPGYIGGNLRVVKVVSGNGSSFLVPFVGNYSVSEISGTSTLYVYVAIPTQADMGYGGGTMTGDSLIDEHGDAYVALDLDV